MSTAETSDSAVRPSGSSQLGHALERRLRFEDTVSAFLSIADQPTESRDDDWIVRARFAVHRVVRALPGHIRTSESVRGIHAEIIRDHPRLIGKVHRIVDDHRRLTDLAPQLERLLADNGRQLGPEFDEGVAQLAELLRRHRRRGSDLVYEAFQVDLGEGH